MIKLSTLSISFLLLTSAHSQISPNAFILGGNFNYASVHYEYFQQDVTSHHLNMSVFAGKTIKQNTVIGIYLAGQPTSKVFVSPPSYAKSKGFEVGPFLRRYKNLSKDLNLFADIEVSYSYFKTAYEESADDFDHTTQSYKLSASPGISYKILKKVHVQAKVPDIFRIRYSRDKRVYELPNPDDYSTSIFEVNSSLTNIVSLGSIVLGFYFEL